MSSEEMKIRADEREQCIRYVVDRISAARSADPMGDVSAERIAGRLETATWIYDMICGRDATMRKDIKL